MRRLLTCALSLAIGLGIFASPEATTTASFMTSFSLSQTALRFRETFGLETDPVILLRRHTPQLLCHYSCSL
jgi:hypothetical protein